MLFSQAQEFVVVFSVLLVQQMFEDSQSPSMVTFYV